MKKVLNLQGDLGDLTVGQVKTDNHRLVFEVENKKTRENPQVSAFISGFKQILKEYENDRMILNIKLKKLELKTGFYDGLIYRNILLKRHFGVQFM